MIYVFDTSPFSTLFRNYYKERFPTLWNHFDDLVGDGRIVSTREVKNEILVGPIADLRDWVTRNREVFTTPTPEEGEFVSQIFSIRHFQQNVELQKLYTGGMVADPFVIAKAAVEGGSVVT
ncbi:unnamed protein product, partial [marine sediment metagenome]